MFGLLALRYIMLGGYGNAALGVMWFAVLGYLLLFGDRQARVIVAQIRLRYENEQLVGQLQQQYALADQARARAEVREPFQIVVLRGRESRSAPAAAFARLVRDGSAQRQGRRARPPHDRSDPAGDRIAGAAVR